LEPFYRKLEFLVENEDCRMNGKIEKIFKKYMTVFNFGTDSNNRIVQSDW
jgi:hypothetical protein